MSVGAENEAEDHSAALSWLLSEWSGRLAAALEAMGTTVPGIEIVDAGKMAGDSIWWAQGLNILREPSLWIGADESAWHRIGTHSLNALGIEAPEAKEAQDTCREILAQSLSGLAVTLTSRFGEEVACSGGELLAAPPAFAAAGFVRVPIDGDAVILCFAVSEELLRKLACHDAFPARTEEESAPHPEKADSPKMAFGSLLDVEMPVSVSLGKVRVGLEDFLTLRSGAVVRMNEAADAPVDLMVNGRTMARGELLVVRGQFAVRIQELSSRTDRLRQLTAAFRPHEPGASSL